MKIFSTYSLLLFFCASLLTACGQKGKLYLEKQPEPSPSSVTDDSNASTQK